MYFLTPIFSFIGGVVACFLVYTLSWKDGLSAFRIILVGTTINTVFVALIDCAESLMGGNNALASFTESRLSMKGWDDFYMLLTYSVVFVVLGVLLASRCDLLALEDRTVGSLGINVTALRIKVSAVAVFLAAICTSVLGTVSFLGLLAPYIGRMLVGSGHKTLIPYSMIAGALLMLLADTTGRTIAAPNEISAAVIMAVIGGPCFIVLLRRASGSYADNMNCFEIDNLSFAYGDKKVIDDFSVQIKKGRVTTIMGPNGSGKSTLLYLMTRELKDYTGSILLDGHDIKEMKGKSFARKAAAVHQYNTVPWDISVRKLVAYGRIPHKNLALGTTTKEDEEAIETALEITGLKELENREVARLQEANSNVYGLLWRWHRKQKFYFLMNLRHI